MPKRKRIRKLASDEIQGEGSWVLVARMTVAEIRESRKRFRAAREAQKKGVTPDLDVFELSVHALKTHVLEWNWVDDKGNPFPQPREDPSVIDRLAEFETIFLSNCIVGSEEQAKN